MALDESGSIMLAAEARREDLSTAHPTILVAITVSIPKM